MHSKERLESSIFTINLEHNLFRNILNWVAFLWQTQIQTIIYGLNDAKRTKKKQITLILDSFIPSDMNFQTILMPNVILAKILWQNIYSVGPFLSRLAKMENFSKLLLNSSSKKSEKAGHSRKIAKPLFPRWIYNISSIFWLHKSKKFIK